MRKILCLFFILPCIAFCIDVAFWKPYNQDTSTYCLLHLDKKDFSDFDVKTIKNVTRTGELEFEEKGRFNGCLKLNGKGALRVEPKEKYSGQFVSLEAWVKLEKYPEDKAYIIYRPSNGKSNEFKFYIDSKGAIVLETATSQKKTEKVSTTDGIIPLNTWIHIAGLSLGAPWNVQFGMRLFVNGKLVKHIKGAGGLEGEEEISPVYIGNDDSLNNGFIGLIDEVRIQSNVLTFWEPENTEWIEKNRNKPVIKDAPYFVSKPSFYMSFDSKEKDASNLETNLEEKNFVDGVKNKGYRGEIQLSNENGLMDSKEGSIEFWYQPYKMDNWHNWNFSIMEARGTKDFWFKLYIQQALTRFPKPLAVYFPYIGDGPGGFGVPVNLYEGKWFHIVLNWSNRELSIYVDGKLQGKNINLGFPQKETVFNSIKFLNGTFDEIYVYDRPLNDDEIYNAYWRYVNPDNLIKDVKPLPAKAYSWILPGLKKVYYEIAPYQIPSKEIEKIKISLMNEKGETVLTKEEKFEEKEKSFDTGEIKEGQYTLIFSIKDNKSSEFKEVERKTFEKKGLAWENNNLGITDKVFSPYEPIKIKGKNVKLVLREYEMNEFGLWNSVICKGKNILAGPIEIKGFTEKGMTKWTKKKGEFVESKDDKCVYKGNVISDPLEIKTTSTIEFDGCMKVEMELLPGEKREKVEKLFLEIPIKKEFAKLLHPVITGPRSNYAGKLPDGEGIIWNTSKISRAEKLANTFIPYIWIGREEEGIAWFGENDKGYITDKNPYKPHEAKVIQEIERNGEIVILRVYLINIPALIDKPTKLVFGLQASPTKPMPENWRKKLPDLPGGLPVHPWLNFSPSNRGPYYDDWEAIDKLIESRYGARFDEKWFEERLKSYDPKPNEYDYGRWQRDAKYWYEQLRRAGPDRPIFCYHEEMLANTAEEAFHTYVDEWTNGHYWPRELLPRIRSHGWSTPISFPESYRDYGVWYANEWLKRGISLYWDNTWFHISYNYRVTDAYIFEHNGMKVLQPCFVIWNEREYFKRIWNLLNYWRSIRKEPLEWTVHMTNTLLLPIHTFATINLDLEWELSKPASPDLLRTESIGLQVGNYPLCLFRVYGSKNVKLQETLKKLNDNTRHFLIDWGMRAVHEIQRVSDNDRGRKILKDLEKILFDFGYGEEKVRVYNYWAEQPFLTVNSEDVKWLALEDTEKKEIMMIFSSWSIDEIDLEVKLNQKNYDGKTLVDATTGEKIGDIKNQTFRVKLWAPYGVMVLKTQKPVVQ